MLRAKGQSASLMIPVPCRTATLPAGMRTTMTNAGGLKPTLRPYDPSLLRQPAAIDVPCCTANLPATVAQETASSPHPVGWALAHRVTPVHMQTVDPSSPTVRNASGLKRSAARPTLQPFVTAPASRHRRSMPNRELAGHRCTGNRQLTQPVGWALAHRVPP